MNSWTYLLIAHGLLAVALLGAITHQVVSVLAPARRPAGSFVARFRSVPAPSYAGAVVVLYILAFVFGAIIYTEYRISVRTVVEQLGMWSQHGAFELKEHFAAMGLAILPAYWHYWRAASSPAEVRARTVLTALLAFIVWWNFLVGHILNNVRGFGS
jgi:hypothetical protein